ncbi:S8 family serine peptidase [candidate division KSB1 bacterium]|nr:S8 family serine peptidase [candidate division KSB1 bacterium]
MKRLTLVILLVSFCGSLIADSNRAHLDKMDAMLRIRLAGNQLSGMKLGPAKITADNRVRIILKGSDPASAIEEVGGTVHTRIGEFATAHVALDRIEDLAKFGSVERMQLSRPVKLHNDQAAIFSEADKVKNGTSPLSMEYDGTDVIVGIIDSGIDIDHEDFKNADGTTRILSIWDQNVDPVVNPPGGFDYGREWTQTQINSGVCTHVDTDGHGTHVAGSAAGNGRAIGAHTGMAPKSDIIMVATNFYSTSIIDGASYIYTKAAALGKPCVINASIGNHFGPHDGTGLESQALDALIAANNGRSFCSSAGNEGNDYMHYSIPSSDSSWTYVHANEDQYAILFIRLPGLIKNTMKIRIGWDFSTYNPNDESGGPYAFVGQTDWYTPWQIIGQEGIFLEASQGVTTLGQIGFFPNTNSGGTTTIAIQIWDNMTWNQNAETVQNMELWRLIIEGANSDVDVWIADIGYPYLNTVSAPNYIVPDNNKSVGMPAVANNVIAVGAYMSRTEWLASDGNTYLYDPDYVVGQLAPFSSIGPSADGRVKPEITAPGMAVISALSSAMTGVEAARLVPGEQHWASQGTSMASPITAGCVALYLQKNPNATHSQIKQAVINSATNDGFTGSLPNNTWGYGKLNIFSMMTANAVEDNPAQPGSFELFAAYPNPFNPTSTIRYQLPAQSKVQLSIYNALGQLQEVLIDQVQSEGTHQVQVDGSDWASGVYLCKIEAAGQIRTTKMILMK